MKQRDPLVYGLIGVIVGGFAIWLLTSNAVNSNSVGMMKMMGINSKNGYENSSIENSIDQHFIEQMIPHHKDAITMAKIAQAKAQKPEIKQLAANIIESQSKEIEVMKTWYKNWFGNNVPNEENNQQNGMMMGRMNMGMMNDDFDYTRLEFSDNFDKEFIEEMIPHHQMAVMMANMLLQGTNRSEMKQLAKDIITAQTKEINDMRQWYRDWGYTK